MKKWTTRVTTGLVVAGMTLAAQSAPAMADEQMDTTTTEIALTEVPTEGVDASDSCGGWRGGLAGYGRWKEDKAGCGWISLDSKKNPQHRRYKWQLPPGSNSRVCVQAQGHYWSTKKKKSVATWTTAGCGTSGTVLVRWSGPPKKGGGYYGLAATPKVRAKVQPGFGGAAYSWK
ncbi:Conserved putative secreted protein [Amycolatopsis japonica]|uniref:Conserved putative secreted protein n=1 Tax=Amycolatopsis japonica TaxID=208439 RepID=A0A075US59_9PSEU|nr:hypothetical protein [Amycolatopsis japonica]AIG75339.1 Conserved putative secreted protein [Amycolatopsis japonica]